MNRRKFLSLAALATMILSSIAGCPTVKYHNAMDYFSLQACVDAQALKGASVCVVDDAWVKNGGTVAEIASIKPTNSNVVILDKSHGANSVWAVMK